VFDLRGNLFLFPRTFFLFAMNLTFIAAETKFHDSLHFPKLKKGIFFSILVPDKGAFCAVVLTEKGWLISQLRWVPSPDTTCHLACQCGEGAEDHCLFCGNSLILKNYELFPL